MVPHAESVRNAGWVQTLYSPNISQRLYSSAELHSKMLFSSRTIHIPDTLSPWSQQRERQVAAQAFWLTNSAQTADTCAYCGTKGVLRDFHLSCNTAVSKLHVSSQDLGIICMQMNILLLKACFIFDKSHSC